MVEDYGRIRALIADVIPGFVGFNERLKARGGFHLGNDVAQRFWRTSTSRARFISNRLPGDQITSLAEETGDRADLLLQTLRSHDQYNTTFYGLDDRYRRVHGTRHVIFVNAEDITRLGFEPGEQVDIVSLWPDKRERRVTSFTLIAYDIPPGQAAAYYPETNPLVPLESYGHRTFTPTSKSVAIKLVRSAIEAGGPLISYVSVP